VRLSYRSVPVFGRLKCAQGTRVISRNIREIVVSRNIREIVVSRNIREIVISRNTGSACAIVFVTVCASVYVKLWRIGLQSKAAAIARTQSADRTFEDGKLEHYKVIYAIESQKFSTLNTEY
jgi:hypothetical protein